MEPDLDTGLETYSAPVLVELDVVPSMTFGKFAEDTQDKDRYFE
ncbi:hypothetical protein [Streptomyces sp. NPDC059003]